jgi:arylsulfatase
MDRLISLWCVEAGKCIVLSIDSRGCQRVAEEQPQISVDRERYIYHPGIRTVPSNAAP